jgi:hypothetical protein
MGAWRSYCSREKEHQDGGSVDRMQQLLVHGGATAAERKNIRTEGLETGCNSYWCMEELLQQRERI